MRKPPKKMYFGADAFGEERQVWPPDPERVAPVIFYFSEQGPLLAAEIQGRFCFAALGGYV